MPSFRHSLACQKSGSWYEKMCEIDCSQSVLLTMQSFELSWFRFVVHAVCRAVEPLSKLVLFSNHHSEHYPTTYNDDTGAIIMILIMQGYIETPLWQSSWVQFSLVQHGIYITGKSMCTLILRWPYAIDGMLKSKKYLTPCVPSQRRL